MKRAWIIGAVILLVVVSPLASLRVATVRAIERIEALQGRTGDFAEIAKPIRTRYQKLESAEQLEHAGKAMGIATLSNLFIFRFNGEGLPYFYGFVAYDTNQHEVVRVVVDQLW